MHTILTDGAGNAESVDWSIATAGVGAKGAGGLEVSVAYCCATMVDGEGVAVATGSAGGALALRTVGADEAACVASTAAVGGPGDPAASSVASFWRSE